MHGNTIYLEYFITAPIITQMVNECEHIGLILCQSIKPSSYRLSQKPLLSNFNLIPERKDPNLKNTMTQKFVEPTCRSVPSTKYLGTWYF